MKNKKNFLIIMILILSILIISCIFFIMNENRKDSFMGYKNNNNIPEHYIAVFHGGVGEIVYETYIYKSDNGHSNFGFDYINVTNTTKHWGSKEWDTKITKRGSVQWTDSVFEIAKENNAYSYVSLPGSNKMYTIEEYMKLFLMN